MFRRYDCARPDKILYAATALLAEFNSHCRVAWTEFLLIDTSLPSP